jgi:uncharacterized membrane protein YphA (DoxX/SURF4 family)
MKIGLWIVQALLAFAFLMAGSAKLFTPMDELAVQMPWVLDLSPGLVRFIGIAEIAGALGVVLPALTRIFPWLTPLAALGLVIVMSMATIFHISRGEFVNIIANLVLMALAAFAAYGRWKIAPVAPRFRAKSQLSETRSHA